MRLLSAYRPWLGPLAFLLSIPLCPRLLAAPPHCWVVTETRHVLRSELPGEVRDARLSIARNEWGSFQVLVRADAPVSGLRLDAGNLKGPDNRAADAIRLVLYRQHQLFLDTGTHRNADFKPDGYPDPLIPFDHPVAGERLRDSRLKAIPFELPAGETHGFWVDVFASTNAAAGEYHGTCQVMAGQEQVAEIPFHLTVWDFALPSGPALETEFGSPAGRLKAYYRERAKAGREAEPTDWAAVETECAQVLCDHRLNAVPPDRLGTNSSTAPWVASTSMRAPNSASSACTDGTQRPRWSLSPNEVDRP